MSFIHVAEGLRLQSWGFTRVGEAYSFLCGKKFTKLNSIFVLIDFGTLRGFKILYFFAPSSGSSRSRRSTRSRAGSTTTGRRCWRRWERRSSTLQSSPTRPSNSEHTSTRISQRGRRIHCQIHACFGCEFLSRQKKGQLATVLLFTFERFLSF